MQGLVYSVHQMPGFAGRSEGRFFRLNLSDDDLDNVGQFLVLSMAIGNCVKINQLTMLTQGLRNMKTCYRVP